MNKAQLKAYYEALHGVLEMELVEIPDTYKELRIRCRQLENRLKSCPDGDRLITIAKNNIQFFAKFAIV